jgi:DNA-binding MarR family transcriptional regulator
MDAKQPHRQQTSTAFLLAQVGARAAQEFAALLAPLKLTPADAGILRLLSRSPGISQQNLARSLDMHASRLVAIVDSLEKRGLVVRNPNAQDRRIYSLHLTGAGDEMLRTVGQLARGHNETICSALDAGERTQLAALLERIAEQQGLRPGVHPGYRNSERPSE